MDGVDIPDGYLLLSEAVARLAQGMWGGLRAPAPLRAIKPKYKRTVSLGFGPWTQEAAKRLRAAAADGKINVFTFVGAQAKENNLDPNPVALPIIVLDRLIPGRESLPDRPIRSSLKIAGGDQILFRRLQLGLLHVQAKEFNNWYRLERAKGTWPSQRSKTQKQGRPSKQTEPLKNAVTNAMREEKTSIAGLRRRLLAMGQVDVPSLDTLARLVDQLYRETGETVFRRKGRRRRNSV
jgi:hypothetical protein